MRSVSALRCSRSSVPRRKRLCLSNGPPAPEADTLFFFVVLARGFLLMLFLPREENEDEEATEERRSLPALGDDAETWRALGEEPEERRALGEEPEERYALEETGVRCCLEGMDGRRFFGETGDILRRSLPLLLVESYWVFFLCIVRLAASPA